MPQTEYITSTYTTVVNLTGDTNLALLRPATQSSTILGYEASMAVDGDIASFSMTAGGDIQPWFKVELAYPVWVTRVEIINDVNPGGSVQWYAGEGVFFPWLFTNVFSQYVFQ